MQIEQRPTGGPPPPIEPTGFFTGVRIRPIIFGVVVDIIATVVASSAYYAAFVAKHLPESEAMSEEAMAEYWTSPEGLTASFVIGSLCTAFGGFIAARKAGRLEVKHGALVGLGSIIVGILMQFASGGEVGLPEWYLYLAYTAAIPVGALGGYVAERLKGLESMSRPIPGGRPGP